MKTTPIVTTYFWKNLECELCKTPYPYEVPSTDGKKMLNIIDYDTPQSEYGEDIYYIVLESISSNTSKVIHVVNMSNTVKLYIGRGHDAHVRVTDISVSRLHAVLIKSTQGYYFLTDNDSKFGTLALVKTPLELQPETLTTLQIGRTLFDFEVKNTYNLTLKNCLCLSTKDKKNNFEKETLISMDGNRYFPSSFASKEFMDNLEKRRSSGVRRSMKVDKKKGKKNLDISSDDGADQNAGRSPNAQNIPTQNQFDDEMSQLNDNLPDN